MASLGSICKFLNGGTPSKAIPEYFEGNIPWITSADISGPVANYARSFITDEAVKNSAVNKVAAGTVLLVTRTGVGKVAIAAHELCFSQDITGLIPDESKLWANYLVHFLLTKKEHFLGLARGATIQGITRNVISDLSIPLPSLPEQRRIAAILDQADALRAKRRKALAQLDSLTQSIFIEMFGDPVTNPMNWPVASLTDVCHCYSGGTPSKGCPEYWQGTLPWFSAKDLKADDLFDSQDHIAQSVTETTNLKLLPENTIAICVRGMILAHTFRVSVLRVPATINQDLKALFPREPIETEYLAACIRAQSNFVLQQVSEAGHGTKRLDALGLREIRVLLPPESRQKVFASHADAIRALRNNHRTAQAELDTLFASLQHRAFRGEL